MRRLSPLWMLVPIVAIAITWFWVWSGHRDRLEADVVPFLPKGTSYAVRGFPYRLDLQTGKIAVAHEGQSLSARLSASQMQVSRSLWGSGLQVFTLGAPSLSLALTEMPDFQLTVESKERGQASLNIQNGVVARLSAQWADAKISSGLLPAMVEARHLEAHLRETPVTETSPDTDPRHPSQAELIIAGRDVHLGAGQSLGFELLLELTAATPITSFASWQDGGTAELREFKIFDSHGEVAMVQATLADTVEGLQVAGTIETVCPAAVRAAAAGDASATYKRLRRPITIVFSGRFPAGVRLEPPADNEAKLPVRGQEPDCPRLR